MDNTKRRRGRPRKKIQQEKSNGVSNIIVDNENKKEDILLHLPININELDLDSESGCTELSDSESEMDYNIFKKSTKSTGKFDTSEFTLTELTINNSSSDEDNEKIQDLKNKIKSLQDELDHYKKRYSTEKIKDGIYELKLNLLNSETGEPVSECTDIACWWCTLNFTNKPFFLPEKCIGGTYYVIGCFCHPSCAAAYNFETINDYKVWERFTLLKKMYKLNKLLIAGPREMLKKFGGPYTSEEYYDEILRENTYKLLFPPMKPLHPILESTDKYNLKPLSNTDLVLKRNKPLKDGTESIFRF
jgi:hypothetical protein